mgnify:CR=1 FL=1
MDVPAIVLSVVEEHNREYGLGIKAFLPKPIDAPVLLSTIEKNLHPDAGSIVAVVIDDESEPASQLIEALQGRGYRTIKLNEWPSELDRTPTELIFVSEKILRRDKPYNDSVEFRKVGGGLVLVYE